MALYVYFIFTVVSSKYMEGLYLLTGASIDIFTVLLYSFFISSISVHFKKQEFVSENSRKEENTDTKG